MFVTIWMCTQEWSLISMRTVAFTFATCHQPFRPLVRVDPLEQRAELPVRALGRADAHLVDRRVRCKSCLLLRLVGDGLIDPLLGLLVERH
jgi:hypothetical protein